MPTLNPGATHIRPTDGAEMVYVPAGEFRMGSTAADGIAADDEKPQHTVYLDVFWIDRIEVTTARHPSSPHPLIPNPKSLTLRSHLHPQRRTASPGRWHCVWCTPALICPGGQRQGCR
jgi:hypothetical protein